MPAASGYLGPDNREFCVCNAKMLVDFFNVWAKP